MKRVCDGNFCVCFAYGQTGAGKTHTMSSLMRSMAADLFAEPGRFAVSFSYFEVLGKQCTDCLHGLPSAEPMEKHLSLGGELKPGEVELKEGVTGEVVVRNLSRHVVGGVEDFLRLAALATSRRDASP